MKLDKQIYYWAHMLDEAYDYIDLFESNAKELRAKEIKNDEYYTKVDDVEKTLMPFAHHFKGKIVLCNCDDPSWSETYLWLAVNFEQLGLKELICVGYECTHMHIINAEHPIDDPLMIEVTNNGDFRTGESLEALKRCDIVISNPPFSKDKKSNQHNMFISFILLPLQYKKDIIGIGPTHGITYVDIADLIIRKKINVLKSPYTKFTSPEGKDKKVQVSVYTTFNDVKSLTANSQIEFTDDVKLYQLPVNLDGYHIALNSKNEMSKMIIPRPSILTNRKYIIVPYNLIELEWRKYFRFVRLIEIKDNFYIDGVKTPVNKFKGCLMQYKQI